MYKHDLGQTYSMKGEALASSPSERSYQEMACAYRQYKKEVRG